MSLSFPSGHGSSFLDPIPEDLDATQGPHTATAAAGDSSRLQPWWDVMAVRGTPDDASSSVVAPSSTRGVEAGHGGDSVVPETQAPNSRSGARRGASSRRPRTAASRDAGASTGVGDFSNSESSSGLRRRRQLTYGTAAVLLVAGLAIGIYFIVANVGDNNNDSNPSPTTPTSAPLPPTSLLMTLAPTTLQDLQETELFLSTLSSEQALNDPQSPQSQATRWFLHVDAAQVRVSSHGTSRCQQRYTLCVLYFALGGPEWIVPSNSTSNNGTTSVVLSGLPECEWSGVICNDEEQVGGLEWEGWNLVGSLPEEIGWLEDSLEKLSLFNNAIVGTLPPSMWNLTQLYWLDISENQLTGSLSEQVWSLEALEFLYLNDNQLNESIPEIPIPSSTTTPPLKHLWLNRNSMTGPLPSSIRYLESLDSLLLHGNSFDSALPSGWSSLSVLKYLDLSSNAFTGIIPEDLYSCQSLTYLYVNDNALGGPLTASAVQLVSLEQVWVNSNQFTGMIPDAYGTLINLTVSLFHKNLLSGAVPASLCNLTVTGQLVRLETDCNDTAAVNYVECDCCTQCH